MSESVTLLRLDLASAVINDSVLYPYTGQSASSFSQTFHELTHGVVRPRLNETSMDPELCSDLFDQDISQQ